MAKSEHSIQFWRGTRQEFNKLKNYDPYTHYSVLDETTGVWKTYFGVKPFILTPGQLEPVLSVISSLDEADLTTCGNRYLFGTDAKGYQILEIGPTTDKGVTINLLKLGTFSVRVKSKRMKEYQYVEQEDGTFKLVTYDDVDCGEYE